MTILLLLFLAADPPNTGDVFDRAAEVYKSLKSYRIEAETTAAVAKRGLPQSYSYKTTLAGDEQGRSYVETRGAAGVEVEVSNGETVWKYTSERNAWSKQEAAQASGAEDDGSENEPRAQDLFSQTARSFIGRYKGLALYANSAVYLKEETVKFNGGKVLCHVYRVPAGKGATVDLWITGQGFYVARQVEKTPDTKIVTEYKQVNNGQPDTALFDFHAPNGAKELANLLLPSERNASLVGTRAADFTLKTLDGETIRLADLQGKVVLLDFWASWCAPCRRELPTIESLSRKLKGTNVVILGVNDEDVVTAKKFLLGSHHDLTTLHDAGRQVTKLYGCYAIPTVFIIDPAGRIAAHYVGGREEPEFMASLRQAGMK